MKYITTLLIISAAIVCFGCGKPYVGHSSIDGSVRQVQNWKIEYERDPQQANAVERLIEEVDPGSSYEHADTAREFVSKVRRVMREKHGFTFAANFPTSGTIKVRLYGSAASEFTPMDTTIVPREILEDVAPDPTYNPDREFSAISPAPTAAILRNDRVSRAHVIIYNERGELAGEIFVGKKPDANVSPKYLADVIAKVIQEGRW